MNHDERELRGIAQWIWTELLTAMRSDGLIATQISTPGDATLQILFKLALDNLRHKKETPWIPIAVNPAMTAQVFAVDFDDPDWPGEIINWSPVRRAWEFRDGTKITRKITHYLLIPPLGKLPARSFL